VCVKVTSSVGQRVHHSAEVKGIQGRRGTLPPFAQRLDLRTLTNLLSASTHLSLIGCEGC
jgi:hypothetical protein